MILLYLSTRIPPINWLFNLSLISFYFLFVAGAFKNKFVISKEQAQILIPIISLYTLMVCSTIMNFTVISDEALKRLLYYPAIIMGSVIILLYYRQFLKIFENYVLIICILGIFEFLLLLYNIDIFPWSRNKLTGLNIEVRTSSIFAEPSFYAAFCLISLMLYFNHFKVKYLVLSQVLLSISFGGYVTLILLMAVRLVSNLPRIFILAIVMYLFDVFLDNVLSTALSSRINYELNHNGSASERINLIQAIIMQDTMGEALLGNGPGMFVNYDPANPSSNNSFIDIGYELGYLGLLVFTVIMFAPLLIRFSKKVLMLTVIFACVNMFKGGFVSFEFAIGMVALWINALPRKEDDTTTS
jgi:hypothetical protein